MSAYKIYNIPVGAMNVNCYVVKDIATGFGAVIDPGGETPENGFEKILTKCEIEGVKIKQIIITHAHFDHILSLESLREISCAPLAAHRFEAAALANPNISYMAQYAGITTPCSPAEHLLEDGDIITVGETELEILHTPGHTPGSICMRLADELFTGDTLFQNSIGRCDLFGGDESIIMQSLKRLIELDGDYKIYPGHGPLTTLSRERISNIFLR